MDTGRLSQQGEQQPMLLLARDGMRATGPASAGCWAGSPALVTEGRAGDILCFPIWGCACAL